MASSIEREEFGRLPGGEAVEAITLVNAGGISVRIITYGAAIQSVIVPDRDGRMADVALGYASLDGYLGGVEYFGCIVGRVANRIAGGRFTLDGRDYQVPINNGPNALHGGPRGFDKVNWEVVRIAEGVAPAVTLRHVSPDGDQGFPGAVETTATYALEADQLSIEYRATSDRPTLVNLSNHAYWNLAGEGSSQGAMGHLLTIPADHIHPTDATAIPTGIFQPVAGTPFDFRQPTAVGDRVRDGADEQIRFARGYDHNWAVARDLALEPRLLATSRSPSPAALWRSTPLSPACNSTPVIFLTALSAANPGSFTARATRSCWNPRCRLTRPTAPSSDRSDSIPARPTAISSSSDSPTPDAQSAGSPSPPPVGA
jgi:aldose 1-epimerase